MSVRSVEVPVAATAEAAVGPETPANAENSGLERDLRRRREAEAFLGVPIPDSEGLFANDEPRFLTPDDMEGLMLERPPFFFIERTVAVGNHPVIGLARMTVERTAGHFPMKPIVPLIELCKAMAQTGIVLVSLHAKPHEAPIAIGAGESKALAKELIAAPVEILVKVTLQAARLKLYIVDGGAFVGDKKIGTLAKIVYTLLPRDQLTG